MRRASSSQEDVQSLHELGSEYRVVTPSKPSYAQMQADLDIALRAQQSPILRREHPVMASSPLRHHSNRPFANSAPRLAVQNKTDTGGSSMVTALPSNYSDLGNDVECSNSEQFGLTGMNPLVGLQVDGVSMRASHSSEHSSASGAETARTGLAADTDVCDVGIAVLLEVSRPEGALLRVSDVEADGTAEMSGQVRKGDLVISIDGQSLAGESANTNIFHSLSEGAPGSFAVFCLMDAVTSQIRTVSLLRAMKASQSHRFLRRQRRLLRALGGDDREGTERLQHNLKLFGEKQSATVPNIVLLGTKASGKTTLLQTLISLLNGGSASLPSDYKHPSPGRGSLTSRVSKIVSSVRPELGDLQPCCVTDTISLEAFGAVPEAASPFFRWVLTGKLQPGVAVATVSACTGCDAGSADQWRAANGVVFLLDACKNIDSHDFAYLSAVRTACQLHGGVPLVVGLCFHDKVADRKFDMSNLIKQCEERLPKIVFFPLALTGREDMCGAAVMEMMARIRTLGVRHSIYGKQEMTWQHSCDFAM